MASTDARWTPHPQVSLQRDGDGALLLHLRTNRYFELNATALRVWELLVAGSSPGAIADALVREFTVGPPEAREVVEALVRDLAEEQLIQRVDRSGPAGGRLGRWLGRLRRV